MRPIMEQRFKKDIGSLPEVFEFIDRSMYNKAFGEVVHYSINLAVEELFTNMVKYNTGALEDILISLKIDDDRITVQLVDFDVDPFDVTEAADANVDSPLEERKIGGLGLHLVKSIVDKLTYEYKNRQMKITLIKQLRP